MTKLLYCLMLLTLFFAAGCHRTKKKDDAAANEYRMITMSEAKEMMEDEDDYIILDVRTEEEYEAGHIPGAICVPNESIGEEEVDELPDKEQLILVYCRSGIRSKQAAKKLAALGYGNIVEFGGILDWDGEVEK